MIVAGKPFLILGGELGNSSASDMEYVDGKWKPGRRLNGDQDHQGRHIRIPVDTYGIQKLILYRF